MKYKILIYNQQEKYYIKDDGTVCRCPVCGLQFQRDVMKIHFSIHAKPGLLHCKECSKPYYFEDSEAPVIHLEHHMRQFMYNCILCGHSAISKEQIEDHINTDHDIPYYRCPCCQKKLHHYKEAKRHVNSRHPVFFDNQLMMGSPSIANPDDQRIASGSRINQNDSPIERAQKQVSCRTEGPTAISLQDESTNVKKIIAFKSNLRTSRRQTFSQKNMVKQTSSSATGKRYLPQENSSRSHGSTSLRQKSAGDHSGKSKQPMSVCKASAKPQKAQKIASIRCNFNESRCVSSVPGHLSKLTPAASGQTHYKAGERSTGIIKKPIAQSYHNQKKINLGETQRQKNDVAGLERKATVDSTFLKHCSISTKKVMKCPICKRMYNPHSIRKHLYSHFNKKAFCIICRRSQGTDSALYEHYLSCHISTKPLKCLLCDKYFKLKKLLIKHMRKTHDIKYRCPNCNLEFKFLKNHDVKNCKRIEMKLRPCKVVIEPLSLVDIAKWKNMNMKMEVEEHFIELENTEDDSVGGHIANGIMVSAPQCSQSFQVDEGEEILNHDVKMIADINAINRNSILCDSKDKGMQMTSSKSHMGNHLQIKPVSDDLDTNTYSRTLPDAVSSVTQNGDTFHKVEEMCTGSLGTDAESQLMQEDEPNLVENKIYRSDPQGKNTDIQESNEHISVYSNFLQNYWIDVEKVLSCPVCEKKCSFHTIKKHFGSHTSSEPICIKCNRLFSKQGYLHEHYLSYHIDVQPYECLLCAKSFKLRKQVLHHLRTIHDIKYKCLKCNKEYQSKMDHHVNDGCDTLSVLSCIRHISAHEKIKSEGKNGPSKNNEIKGHIKEEISMLGQDNQPNTVKHKTSSKQTVSGDKIYHGDAAHANKAKFGCRPIHAKTMPILVTPRGQKRKQSCPSVTGDSSSTQPRSIEIDSLPLDIESALKEALDSPDSNADEYHLFADLDELALHLPSYKQRLDNLIPEYIDSDRSFEEEIMLLQKSAPNIKYKWILNGNDEQYTFALEKEAYFIDKWMRSATLH